MLEFAYDDTPLPIAADQTISQPYIVAEMIDSARVAPGERVLEIGAGSGYAAAVLSRIAADVFTVERHEELARSAERRLRDLGYDNVRVLHADGTQGWPEHAPYDAIVVSAGGPSVPDALLDQLAVGGRLLIPIGSTPRVQRLMRVVRRSAQEYSEEDLGSVQFVPLIGTAGWSEKLERPRLRTADAHALGRLIRESAEASFCSARRPTERPSSTACARASPVSSSCDAAFAWSPSKPIGPTRPRSIATCGTYRTRSAAGKPSSVFPPGCGGTGKCSSSSSGCASTTASFRGAKSE
jgi:protein-L-isoaspartate(D-aspartate) O-methyltransferase